MSAESVRWARQHAYGPGASARRWEAGGKVKYRTSWAAAMMATQINKLNRNAGEVPLVIYPCRWADRFHEGETAPLHWHIGHPLRAQENDRLL